MAVTKEQVRAADWEGYLAPVTNLLGNMFGPVPKTTGIITTGGVISKTNDMYKAEENFKNNLEAAGLSKMTPREVITLAYEAGEINPKDYNRILQDVEDLEKDGVNYLSDEGFFQKWIGNTIGWRGGSKLQYTDLFNTLNEFIPKLERLKGIDVNSIPDIILGNSGYDPNAFNVPGPTYLDTNFKNYLRDVDPVKLWTGQELADLHNINYDVNHYYDLIKQATEAGVKYGNYSNEQAMNAARRNDEARMVSYLDALRNVKSEAVANGTAAGARAAQEVLANVAASTDRANTINDTITNNMSNIDKYILNNAKAKLSAVDYFNQLAESLSQDSATLYANDTNRFGADWNANALLYKGDEYLRGKRAYANLSMEGAYKEAAAAANMYRNQALSNVNQLRDLWTIASNSYDTTPQAFAWVFDQLKKDSSNGNTGTVLKAMINESK